jgi:hypothetical protein
MQSLKKETASVDVAYWQLKLREAVNSAKNREDALAMKCFEKAMIPLLKNPENLRTLLGKIAAADII